MRKPEFSKLVLASVMLVYFWGVGFASYVVVQEHSMLGELLAYLGAPTATAIGFYAWKAKSENVIKLTAPKNLENAFLERECDDIVSGTDDNFGCGDSYTINNSTDIPAYQPEIESPRMARVRRVRGGKGTREIYRPTKTS